MIDQGCYEFYGKFRSFFMNFALQFVGLAMGKQIQENCQLFAVGLLKLLYHEFASTGGGAPVNPSRAISRAVGTQAKKVTFVGKRASLLLPSPGCSDTE